MSKKENRKHYKVERLKCRPMVEKMLAEGYIYEDIVQAVKDEGENISSSALQRYHTSYERIAERFTKVREQMTVLIDAVKNEPRTDMAEVASQIMMQGLFQRLATAGEEFDRLPLDKAGRLVAQLERTAIARENLKIRLGKAFDLAEKKLLAEVSKALVDYPELQIKLAEIIHASLEKAKEEAGE